MDFASELLSLIDRYGVFRPIIASANCFSGFKPFAEKLHAHDGEGTRKQTNVFSQARVRGAEGYEVKKKLSKRCVKSLVKASGLLQSPRKVCVQSVAFAFVAVLTSIVRQVRLVVGSQRLREGQFQACFADSVRD